MNVLSLFDGISTGQLALNNVKIPIDNYFASEVDPSAIKVTTTHYPSTIHLGDVNNVNWKDLPPIDLLIGGSPCSGFSIAGKKAYFNDYRSKLLYKYVEAKIQLNPRYFLLENVSMPKACTDHINELLGVEYTLINSEHFSAQNRKRLYWTNIPVLPYDQNPLVVKDILEPNVSNIYTANYSAPFIRKSFSSRKLGYYGKDSQANRVYNPNYKGVCLCGEAGGGGGKTGFYEIGNVVRKLTPVECERMQTMPDNYTDCGIKETQRYRALGNGWTCKVIEHIFSGIISS